MQAPKAINEKPFAFVATLAAAFTGGWVWCLVRFWMDFYTPIPWVREGGLFVAYWSPPSLSDVLIATAIALMFGGAGIGALIRTIRQWRAVRWFKALVKNDPVTAAWILQFMMIFDRGAMMEDPPGWRVATALVKLKRSHTRAMKVPIPDDHTEVMLVGGLPLRVTPEDRAAFEQSKARADEARQLRQQHADGGQPPMTSEVVEGGDLPHGP